MRVCIFEGRERVACSLLYPIFKFGKNYDRIHTLIVYSVVGFFTCINSILKRVGGRLLRLFRSRLLRLPSGKFQRIFRG